MLCETLEKCYEEMRTDRPPEARRESFLEAAFQLVAVPFVPREHFRRLPLEHFLKLAQERNVRFIIFRETERGDDNDYTGKTENDDGKDGQNNGAAIQGS